MNERFILELVSDLDFEGMVVEISFQNQMLIRLNYDKGIDNIEMEIISSNENAEQIIFPLEDFLNAIGKAKDILSKCFNEDKLKDEN